jgi:hypothetical protein
MDGIRMMNKGMPELAYFEYAGIFSACLEQGHRTPKTLNDNSKLYNQGTSYQANQSGKSMLTPPLEGDNITPQTG